MEYNGFALEDMLVDEQDKENNKKGEKERENNHMDEVDRKVQILDQDMGNKKEQNDIKSVIDQKIEGNDTHDKGGYSETHRVLIPDNTVMVVERNSGGVAVVEEYNRHGKDTQQSREPSSINEIEANPKENEGLIIGELNGKCLGTNVDADGDVDHYPKENEGLIIGELNGKCLGTNVDADGDVDHNEMIKNKVGSFHDPVSENKDCSIYHIPESNNDANNLNETRDSKENGLAAGEVKQHKAYAFNNSTSEKLNDDTKDRNDTKMIEKEAEEAGTPEEQAAFLKKLEKFHMKHALEFKPPKFYGQTLNLLKLYRTVTRLGGYDRVTGSKLWRQIGESFHPPKTCTTVSWTFRIFYEKALLEYERHELQSGELQLSLAVVPERAAVENKAISYQTLGSGRARRDTAASVMQGWHSQCHYGSKEDKSLNSVKKGSLKHNRGSEVEYYHPVKAPRIEASKQLITTSVDVGRPADWVKINARESKDCFEVYALVPGLLREEIRVQSDPAGSLVISGQPKQLDNPWGITAFKKVVSLPARIDPLQTYAVVSLHGRLFVRAPFEQSSG